MEEKRNSGNSNRILVLYNNGIAEDVRMIFFLEELKKKYPLRICRMAKEEKECSKRMFQNKNWSTGLPERVLNDIGSVLLSGIPQKLLGALENGILEEPVVELITLCFGYRIPVYLWEGNQWKESVPLPEPIKKMQERKKNVCAMYHILPLKESILEEQKKSNVYTMEDVVKWESNVTIQKGDYFTPLAKDYIREKKIRVEYE